MKIRCSRPLRGIVLSAGLMLAMSAGAADGTRPSGRASIVDYTAMITKLAILVGHAEQCGDWLNDYGAEALKSPACKDLQSGFYAEWPDRETLREIIAREYEAVEQGRRPCDSDCADRLQRIEELRVTLTYYLDYIDYMKELQ